MTKNFKFNASYSLGLKITKSLQFNITMKGFPTIPKECPNFPNLFF